MIVVTGGAGFIGSTLIRALNSDGIDDILVVDDLSQKSKYVNLLDCQIADFMSPEEVYEAADLRKATVCYHLGAITDTTCHDGKLMMRQNFSFSKMIAERCIEHDVRLVYASSAAVYGDSHEFAEMPVNENPLNVYGYSKLLFDNYVRMHQIPAVGLRFFNVYGGREGQKGNMASMPNQLYWQLRATGQAKIFEPGNHQRDFVYVDDIVDMLRYFGEENEEPIGVFNAGSGIPRTFQNVAELLIEQLGEGKVHYIEFPESLLGYYQDYTQADLDLLRQTGYYKNTTSLEIGISKLVQSLS